MCCNFRSFEVLYGPRAKVGRVSDNNEFMIRLFTFEGVYLHNKTKHTYCCRTLQMRVAYRHDHSNESPRIVLSSK